MKKWPASLCRWSTCGRDRKTCEKKPLSLYKAKNLITWENWRKMGWERHCSRGLIWVVGSRKGKSNGCDEVAISQSAGKRGWRLNIYATGEAKWAMRHNVDRWIWGQIGRQWLNCYIAIGGDMGCGLLYNCNSDSDIAIKGGMAEMQGFMNKPRFEI